jgi:ABC-type antimicrobial peptide transport system permease subunit
MLTQLNIALTNLRINKRRSILTTLGLIIGIGSVILVMSAGAGAQSLITGAVQTRGTDQIVVLAGASESDGPPASALGVVVTTLTEDDKDALLNKNNVEHLTEASGYITGSGVLQWESEERNITFTGANAAYEQIEKVTLASGVFFSEAQNKERERVLVLGSEVARDLFGDIDPIGEVVRIDRKRFEVIGVLSPKGSTIFEDVDNTMLMPLQTAQYDMMGVRHVSFIRALVSDERYLDTSQEEIRETLIDRHGEEDFSIRNTADLLTILETVTNALKFFLVGIAAVSLFVGGVGIMNIMLIAVNEKTREIGLRKAVGARRADILFQFLIETVILSLLGGFIGVIGGILLAALIYAVVHGLGYTDYQFIVSPIAVAVSFGIAAAIGLVFGVYPARKAAELDPIDALRYE